MRALAFLCGLTLLLCLTAMCQEAPPKECSIRGTVNDAVTNQLIGKAYLRLVGISGKSSSYNAVSDDRGTFLIERVEPGSYVLQGEHQGYITDHGPTDEIRLSAGQVLSEVRFALTPQAVISGRVVDEDGDAWVHAQVNVLYSQWQQGKRKIDAFNSGEVNDEGEFRIGQLPPGKYYLAAEPDGHWERMNRQPGKDVLSRQTTMYPSAIDLEGSTPVIVGPGARISGLEIRLRRGSSHAVRGRLVGGDAIPPSQPNDYFGKRSISLVALSGAPINARPGVIHADGTFEIEGVPPGSYDISVKQGYPPVNLGRLSVRLSEVDIENLLIPLSPPHSVKGQIKVEGGSTTASAGIGLVLDSFSDGWTPPVQSQADGTFAFPPMAAERYRVIVRRKGFYLKEIRYGDVKSSDGTVILTSSDDSLILLLSDQGAHLTGTLIGQTSRANVQVALTGGTSQAQMGVFDQTGTFHFDDFAPGDYVAYVCEEAPNGAWDDPLFIKEIADFGTKVHLAEGETKSAEMPVIPKAEMDRILSKLGMQ